MKKTLKIFLIMLCLFSVKLVYAVPMPPRHYMKSDDCPKEAPFLSSWAKKECVGCDYLGEIEIAKGHEKDFDICPNRETKSTSRFEGELISVLKKCPPEAPLRTKYGCKSCDSWVDYFAIPVFEQSDCQSCPGLTFNKSNLILGEWSWDNFCIKQCPQDKPMQGKHGYCDSCDSLSLEIKQKECAKCPNRVYEDHLCLFKEIKGKDGNPLLMARAFGTDGIGWTADLYSCGYPYGIQTTKSSCDQCPNRYYKENLCILKTNCQKEEYATLDGKCIPCNENDVEIHDVLETECRKCPQRLYKDHKCAKCSKGKIANSNGGCEPCDTPYVIYLLDKDNKSCPNRITQKIRDDVYISSLKECPKNYPIKNGFGSCVACEVLGDLTHSVGVSKEDCKKCGGLYQGNLCLPKNRPLVMKLYSFSLSCDEKEELATTPENCALCPNREYVDSKCVLKKEIK